MLAEPLKVQRYVIEEVVRVLIDQLLQGPEAAHFTDDQQRAKGSLADDQRLFPCFL